MGVLIDRVGRDLAAQDAGEDVELVVGLSGVDRHGRDVSPRTGARQAQLCNAKAARILRAMASLAPRPSLLKLLFEPLGGLQLVGAAILVWLAGAGYCHGYQRLLTGESPGPWSGA